MHRSFRITVDGRSYSVVVEELEQQNIAAAASLPSIVPPPSPTPTVSAAATASSLSTETSGAIVAPLAGVVFSIDVPLGHTIAVGDKVATIEAMKMKTEVHAKAAGKVVSVAVKTNESVETGQVLMTLG